MEFRLVYRGRLTANGGLVEKQEIRRNFHRQLKVLYDQQPLKSLIDHCVLPIDPRYEGDDSSWLRKVGSFVFQPLVCAKNFLTAQLSIEFLRPQEPGNLLSHSGDIDNRLKTLFDALRMPRDIAELPPNDSPAPDETPFFCLLDDDALITAFSVATDRLLESAKPSEVLLIIRVRTVAIRQTSNNVGLG